MRQRLFQPVLILSGAAGILASCGGGKALSYEEAMNLMRERTSDPIRASFNASPRSENQDPKITEAYQKLMDAHVIACKTTTAVGTFCEPGPAGSALTQTGLTDLTMVAGKWVPLSIVAIQRTGRSSATADVRMSFEPAPLFNEFEESLDVLQPPGASSTPATRKQGKVVKVNFQRYEDGWHIESVE